MTRHPLEPTEEERDITKAQLSCPACDSRLSPRSFVVTEHMYGTGGAFRYGECPACNSVYLIEPPDDLSAHYPGDYYSFHRPQSQARDMRSLIRPLLSLRTRLLLVAPPSMQHTLIRMRLAPGWHAYLGGRGLTVHSAICDVGCGSGDLLFAMAKHGFEQLTGIDPYLPELPRSSSVVNLSRRTVTELVGAFDAIMMHHSLEHMSHPAEVLVHLRRQLAPGGLVVLRVPIADCEAYASYGPDWVQLDAPRHLFVPSQRGVVALAGRAGYTVEDVVFDSSSFQFWGSELCRRGKPIAHTDPRAVFGRRQLLAYSALARRLNRTGRGDQASFLLRDIGTAQ